MKRLILLVLTVISLFSASMFLGCSCNEESEGFKITFQDESVDLVLEDNYTLLSNVEYKERENIEWSMDKEGVIILENGEVYANRVGTVVVTGKYLETSDTVTINVTTGSYDPLLTSSVHSFNKTLQAYEVSTALGDEVKLNFEVSFNKKNYAELDSVVYKVEDSNVGEITDGVFKAKSVGSTRITVSAVWKGVSAPALTQEIIVTVKDKYVVMVNDARVPSSLNLYTTANFRGVEYQTSVESFDVDVTKNGSACNDVIFSIKSGSEDLIAFESGKLVAKKSGFAYITVKADGGNFEYDIAINVIKPTADYQDDIKYFSVVEGELLVGNTPIDIDALFVNNGGSANLKARAGSENLIFDGSKISGLKLDDDGKRETVITIYNDEVEWNFNVNAYTDVIRTVDDIRNIFKACQSVSKETVGENLYFKGTNSTIDANGNPDGGFKGYYKNIDNQAKLIYTRESVPQIAPSYGVTVLPSGTKVEYACVDNKYYKVLPAISGYYALANDIDASGYIHDNGGYDYNSDQSVSSNFVIHSNNSGLVGTFDGDGHVIKNITLGKGGLFGNVSTSGTVKNLSLVDVKFKEEDKACTIGGFVKGTLDNVYIHAERLANKEGVALVAHTLYYNAYVTNCIFALEQTSISLNGYGSLSAQFRDYKKNDGTLNSNPLANANSKWSNSYVISNLPLIKDNVSLKATMDSEASDKNYKLTGIKRVESRKELLNMKNSYARFNSSVWDVWAGTPVWKGLSNRELEVYVNGNSVQSLSVVGELDIVIELAGRVLEKDQIKLSIKRNSPEIINFNYVDNAWKISKAESISQVNTILVIDYDVSGNKGWIELPVIVTDQIIDDEIWFSSQDDKLYIDKDGTLVEFTGYNEKLFTEYSVGELSSLDNTGSSIEGKVVGAKTEDGKWITFIVKSVAKVYTQTVNVSMDGKNFTDQEYTDMFGTTAVTIDRINDADGERILVGSITNVQPQSRKIFVNTNRGIAYVTNAKVYTKIFREISEFYDYFRMYKGKDAGNNDVVHTFKGSYLLGDNFDATGRTSYANIFNAEKHYFNEASQVLDKSKGFHGYFDGNGKTISNLTIGDGGIFGYIGSDAVIKNVKFTNVTYEARDYVATFAKYIDGATIDNVLIQINDMFVGSTTGTRKNFIAGLALTIASETKLSNVVIETLDPINVDKRSYEYGSIACSLDSDDYNKLDGWDIAYAKDVNTKKQLALNWTNVYVISPAPLIHKAVSCNGIATDQNGAKITSGYSIDAPNAPNNGYDEYCRAYLDGETLAVTPHGTTYLVQGAKRFTSLTDYQSFLDSLS